MKSKFLIGIFAFLSLITITLFSFTTYESYSSLYDAEYVGSESCKDCHSIIYSEWKSSPHAKMTRKPSSESVVGNFKNGEWFLPDYARKKPIDFVEPAAKMFERNGEYFMALRHPLNNQFIPFKIEFVIGYQYRQTYITREAGGILRRLPLQWSVPRQDFFPYWNYQETSEPSVQDLWAQMQTLNSAWNLFCARCHTTSLTVEGKNPQHTQAKTHWVDEGIACEACHGPGSQHNNYFEGNYVNRVAAFVNSKLRGQPVAYIANAPKLTKGQDLSVCGRCHGADIFTTSTDIYRIYEPGYSREGKTNDLSKHFREAPLQAGRTQATIECWEDSRPKGIGMLFRSFVESDCYQKGEVRCYDCHQAHNNKVPTKKKILQPSEASNNYCLNCHTNLKNKIEEHSFHKEGTSGSFCYDCHMPNHILSMVSGVDKMLPTHTMSSIPNPKLSQKLGLEGSPNACNDCHYKESTSWAIEWSEKWWGKSVNN